MTDRKPLAALLVVLFVGFATGGAAQTPSGSPYKIGVTFPLTGPFASSANDYLPAAQIAVADVNRDGGVNGHPLQLVIEDTQGTPEGGIAAMRKVVEVDGAQAVLTIYTNVVTAQIPLADQLKVPFLSPVEAPNLVNKGRYSFSHAASAAATMPMLRDYWRATHVRRVFSFVPSNAFGPVIGRVAEGAAKGVAAAYEQISFELGQTDYSGLVARALQFRPDAVFIGAQGGTDETVIIRELREVGIKAPIFVSGIFYDEPAWRAGVGSYVSGIIMAGLNYDPTAARRFIAEYHAKTGQLPSYPAGEIYDMVKMFAAAIAQSSDNGPAVRDALATLKGVPSVFGGTITMAPDHYSIPQNDALWHVRNGELARATP